ncbi:hypothetical protein HY994_02990 [Candidatus Micrarchaeota archaeon]|nr:hypothetical protein [Candidatus Micrarchaeota archaeon]
MLKVILVALLLVGVALYGCTQPPSGGTPGAGYGGNPSASPGTDSAAFSSVDSANSDFGHLESDSVQLQGTGDVDGSDIERAG